MKKINKKQMCHYPTGLDNLEKGITLDTGYSGQARVGQKHIDKQKGFTLVELIIVITILAILATIAFISFQGYTKNARDSNRTATISNLQKGLDIYSVQVGNLPEPDGTILSGTLNGVQLNRLGVIGDNISRLVKINKTPTDPVGGNNYAYGVSADNKSYQIGVTLENPESYNSIIKTTYADNGSYRAKVVGNYKYPFKYNGKLYSLPSLLFTGTGGDLSQTGNAYFVINNGQNIPYHPAGTLSNTQNTTQVLQSITGTGNLVLTGITLPTETSDTFKTLTSTSTTIQNLQQALGITDQAQLGNVIYGSSYNTNTSVSATSGGSSTSAVGTFSLSSTSVSAGTNVTITSNCTTSPTSYTSSNISVATISGTTITTLSAGTTNITPVGGSCSDSSAKTLTVTTPTWTQLDTNCTIPDITIGSQTWAGCNSTLGSGIEWTTNSSSGTCYSYSNSTTTTSCTDANYMASNKTEKSWSIASTNSGTVNNIWGKLYTWTGSTGLSANCKGGDFSASSSNSNCPCPTGRHVPTDAEFITLSTTLNGSLCETTTGWQCTGLGWMNNHTKTASNNIVQALKIPLAGYRNADGSTFYNRGYYTYLWSSSVSGTSAYSRNFDWSLDTVDRVTSNQSNGFSVRCLKD